MRVFGALSDTDAGAQEEAIDLGGPLLGLDDALTGQTRFAHGSSSIRI
jgi:hypothetical protein